MRTRLKLKLKVNTNILFAVKHLGNTLADTTRLCISDIGWLKWLHRKIKFDFEAERYR